MTRGPDGNIWFIEQAANEIATFNPTTHATTSFLIPTANAYATGITAGPDGNIYFTEETPGKIGIFNPATETFSEVALKESGAFPYGITAGADGNIYFTNLGTSEIGMLSLTTHAISLFATPTAHAEPEGITAGPGGNLYFTEFAANKLGMINTTTDAMTEFAGLGQGSEPSWITAGPDGKIYFTEYGSGKIGVLNPTSHVVSEVGTPTAASYPTGIAVGPDGNIYFAEQGTSRIGMINLASGAVSELITPNGGSAPYGITAGPNGNVWFTEAHSGAIGSVNLQIKPQLVITTGAPASVNAGSGFGLVVTAEYDAGMAATDYNGSVTVALSSGPGVLGGTLTLTAWRGVATFNGLTLSAPGSGEVLLVTGSGAASATSGPFDVTGGATTGGGSSTGTAPFVTIEQLVRTGRARRALVARIVLHFASAPEGDWAGAAGNYQVLRYVRHGHGMIERPVGFHVIYNAAAQTAGLILSGKRKFAAGGEVIVRESPESSLTALQF
jgi:streptogramin lyase